MIALGYGVTYIWGTVGIILICKYLPRWWGVDAKAAAKQYEEEHGVKNVDDAGITGYRAGGLRAYRVENPATSGKSISAFRKANPQYKIVNVVRGDEVLGASPDLVLQNGDVVALGGKLEDLTSNLGLVGAEVAHQKVLNIPLDQAEILLLDDTYEGRALKEFAKEDFAGQFGISRIERAGEPIPVGAETILKRFDVIFVSGLKGTIEAVAAKLGKIARPSTSTDLLTLAVGMRSRWPNITRGSGCRPSTSCHCRPM